MDALGKAGRCSLLVVDKPEDVQLIAAGRTEVPSTHMQAGLTEKTMIGHRLTVVDKPEDIPLVAAARSTPQQRPQRKPKVQEVLRAAQPEAWLEEAAALRQENASLRQKLQDAQDAISQLESKNRCAFVAHVLQPLGVAGILCCPHTEGPACMCPLSSLLQPLPRKQATHAPNRCKQPANAGDILPHLL